MSTSVRERDAGLSPLYEVMLAARLVGERLSREEAISFFPYTPASEAAVIGATAALEANDWIFPSHGDFGAALLRGLSIAALVHRAFGDEHDPLAGHDMPGGLSARAQRIGSVSACAANHLPHAVGFAYGARMRGEDLVTSAFFDGPDVAAADFHTGLNFAGVMRAPVVFVCRVRAGEESAAEHAIAYGLASARCDGGDLADVVRTVKAAAERARGGEGATVIDVAIGSDPLARVEVREDARARVDAELSAAIAAARSARPPAVSTIHDGVYAKR